MAVFKFFKNTNKKMQLIEIAPDTNIEEVKKSTGCDFDIADDLKVF